MSEATTTTVAVPERNAGLSLVEKSMQQNYTPDQIEKLVALRERAAGYQPLFKAGTPDAIVSSAAAHANALAGVIESRRLFTMVRGKKHVHVEGWTLLGSMLGVFPVCVWTKPVTADNGTSLGWEARVEARTRTGEVVGAAESQCLRSEKTWAGRDDFSLRSMAQTRATSKALRLPLGFVMVLAGYEATPSEEMGVEVPVEVVVSQETASAEIVSPEQVKELVELMKRKGTKPANFLAWAGARDYGFLTVAKFKEGMAMLAKKPDVEVKP